MRSIRRFPRGRLVSPGFYHQKPACWEFCSFVRSNTISADVERRHLAGGAQAFKPASPNTDMIDLLVNYNEFWARLSEDIAAAERSVFVQTFAFEGDTVGKQLS